VARRQSGETHNLTVMHQAHASINATAAKKLEGTRCLSCRHVAKLHKIAAWFTIFAIDCNQNASGVNFANKFWCRYPGMAGAPLYDVQKSWAANIREGPRFEGPLPHRDPLPERLWIDWLGFKASTLTLHAAACSPVIHPSLTRVSLSMPGGFPNWCACWPTFG